MHTSSSLKAARLFNPWTLASLAKKSLPCRDFHLVDEDEDRNVGALKDPDGKHVVHLRAAQKDGAGQCLAPRSALSVSCWKTRRDNMRMLDVGVDAMHHSSFQSSSTRHTVALN